MIERNMMGMRAVALPCLMLAALLAFSAAASAAGPEDFAESYIVWGIDKSGNNTSQWIGGNGPNYKVLVIRTGAFLAADNALWEVAQDRVPMKLCEECDPAQGKCTKYGTGQNEFDIELALRRLGSDQKIVLIDWATGSDLLVGYHRDITLLGLIGPYLFVMHQDYQMTCGAAHGNMSAEFFVWDLGAKSKAVLYSGPEIRAVRAKDQVRAFQRLKANDWEGRAASELEFTAIHPQWSKQSLELGYQFTGEACYACSDGLWESYSRSEIVDAHSIPKKLQPFAEPPAAISAFMRDHPEVTIRGFSTVDPGHKTDLFGLFNK